MNRLSRLLIGGDGPTRDLVAGLRRHYDALVHRSRRLARHAEISPNEASRQRLTHLAHEEAGLAERLRKMLGQLDSFAGDVADVPDATEALNHWGRLVQDLQEHREAIKGLMEISAHAADEDPELSAELRELGHDEERHALSLRELIARADPHAIN